MRVAPRTEASSSNAQDMSASLKALMDSRLETHREAILRRHPSLNEFLAGRCPVVLYPAARMATRAAELLQARGVDVRGFADKDPGRWGKAINGLPVVAPKQIAAVAPGVAVLVASSLYDSEICEYLAECSLTRVFSMPFLNYCLPDIFASREYFQATEAPYQPGAKETILCVFDLLADDVSRQVLVSKIRYYLTLDKRCLDAIRSRQPIYFDPAVFRLRPDEVVVDAGAFNGDTLCQFLKACGGRFRRYFAFEPDPGAFGRLQAAASGEPRRVQCVQAGLSDQTGTLRFSVTGAADSAVATVADAAATSLPVVDLDSYFKDRETPTLVKMDIEGSERAALHGAQRVVTSQRPVLAVSAYQYPRDLWEIPNLIHKLEPSYRVLLRHYTREIDDTVCYGVPPAPVR